MPATKGNMLKYSKEQMEAAIEAVHGGLAVATAAKQFNVPRITLLYKSKGKSPRGRKMGPESFLTYNEEKVLVNWVITVARAGFPIGKEQLLDSVQMLVRELNRDTPFTNNRPGKSWYASFLKRNPELRTRTAQNLTASRAAVTEDHIQGWFTEIGNYLQQNNYSDILNDPSRVFNGDETAFFLNPKGNRVLAAKGEKNIYQHINSDEKECLTVLITGNAAGDLTPPMVVFKYERVPREITLSIPEDWGVGKSENGWMTGETFYEYISNIFQPWLIRKGITLPVIFFIDGHTSHMTLHTSKFCDSHGIILVALYPNATHLIQPMDVAVFRTLKEGWKTKVHQWRIDNLKFPILKKVHFCPLLQTVLDERITKEILQNGFRKCGLVPWNSKAIYCKKNLDGHDIILTKTRLKEIEDGIIFLEKYVNAEKINTFKASNIDTWQGDVEDFSLFKFYKETVAERVTLQKKINDYKKSDKNNQVKEVKESDTFIQASAEFGEENENDALILPDEKIKENENNSLIQSVTVIAEANRNGILLQPDKEIGGNDSFIHSAAEIEEGNKNEASIQPMIVVEENDHDSIQPSTSRYELTPLKNIEINQQTPQPKFTIDPLIPSPFKRVLFWPEPKEQKIKRKKEKIPSVITAKEWQLYYENKDNIKKQKEEIKRKKAEERLQKKQLQEKMRNERKELAEQRKKLKGQKIKEKKIKKISSDSDTEEEWVQSGSSLDDISDEEFSDDVPNEVLNETYKEGEYILVSFPGKKRQHKYVCVIQQILPNEEAEVVAMKCCNELKTTFKLNEDDISIIKYDQILTKLVFPKMTASGDRLKYEFNIPINVDG